MHLKIPSEKYRQFCLCLNMIKAWRRTEHIALTHDDPVYWRIYASRNPNESTPLHSDAIASQITGNSIVCSIAYPVQHRRNIRPPHHCPLSTLQWRHNGLDSVSNHHPHHCLLSRSFGPRSKKTSKLRVTGLCAGNSPGTGEFPAQMASYAGNISIWWRHHAKVNPQAKFVFSSQRAIWKACQAMLSSRSGDPR